MNRHVFPLIVSSLISAALPQSSTAGTFTDAPGALQGDVAIQHMTQTIMDTLYEADTIVGTRQQLYNDTTLRIKFGVLDAISLEAVLPYGTDKVSFSGVNQMKYDPLSESGSYLDTPALEDFSRSGKGLEGTQLGLYFFPFHTKIHSNRGDVGNWQMGVIYRLRDSSNFLAPNGDGVRGSGVGAAGLGLHTAFSKRAVG